MFRAEHRSLMRLVLGRAFNLREAWRRCVSEFRYARAAQRWEGWGRKGDPRNDRPWLTREQWEREQASRHDGRREL